VVLNKRILPYQLGIFIALILAWQLIVSGSSTASFLYGSPQKIASVLIKDIANGRLISDTLITLSEMLIGFILGNLLGLIVGLGLWYSETAFRIVKPYIIVLGSIPAFALAPLLIIWFGTGILSKVILVILSTFILTAVQSYKGASEVDRDKIRMLKTFGAKKSQIFKLVVFPSSFAWVLSALKLNIGFALLGAFIGEFISSEAGLGHYIIVASGLYDIPSVFAGVIIIALIALILNFVMDSFEKKLTPWALTNQN
jgi:NitT/TauT family transport system permease protein